jgi:hypothetical protein
MQLEAQFMLPLYPLDKPRNGHLLFWFLSDDLFPRNHFCMACLAFRTIFAFVYVVLLMAEIAIVPEMFIFINAKFVTTVAFKSDVLAAYAITVAFAEVIEGCFFPVLLEMTGVAHWPVLALVYIAFLMAVEAKRRHLVGEPAACVATHAFGLFVLAQQE